MTDVPPEEEHINLIETEEDLASVIKKFDPVFLAKAFARAQLTAENPDLAKAYKVCWMALSYVSGEKSESPRRNCCPHGSPESPDERGARGPVGIVGCPAGEKGVEGPPGEPPRVCSECGGAAPDLGECASCDALCCSYICMDAHDARFHLPPGALSAPCKTAHVNPPVIPFLRGKAAIAAQQDLNKPDGACCNSEQRGVHGICLNCGAGPRGQATHIGLEGPPGGSK